MAARQRSEKRQRTANVLVRLTPAEKALVDAVVRQQRARGAGTVLRDAFMDKWRLEVLGAPWGEPGQPDTTPALPAARRPAQARAGGTEPMSGRR